MGCGQWIGKHGEQAASLDEEVLIKFLHELLPSLILDNVFERLVLISHKLGDVDALSLGNSEQDLVFSCNMLLSLNLCDLEPASVLCLL